MITFNVNLTEPFLPLLTGMFGLSGLIINSKNNPAPNQLENTAVESGFFELLKVSIIGILASIVMMLVPSISPSQIGFFAAKYKDDELKVASLASINIADVILSLSTFFYISKARSGVVEKIGQALTIGLNEYYLMIIAGFFALLLSCFLAVKVNKKLSDNLGIISSKYFKTGIIVFVSLLTIYFDGLMGIIILAVSTILGVIVLKNDARPVNLMGSLAVPTIIFFILRLF